MSAALPGCGGIEDVPGDETSATRSQRFTQANARILGFEDPESDWTSSNGPPILPSATRSQGAASLAVTPTGYTELLSDPMPAPGGSLATATLDIRLPTVLSWGEVRLVTRIPSQGHYWRDLGAAPLAGRSAGSFHSLDFAIPPDVRAALDSSATDVDFRIVLNVPGNVGTFFIDHLVVSDETIGPPTGGGTTSRELSLAVPIGSPVDETLLSASERITVDDRVTIGQVGSLPRVASLGSGTMELGASASLFADVSAAGDIDFLRSGSNVAGSLLATGMIVQQDNVTIGGSVSQGTISVSGTSWSVAWPTGTLPDVTRAPDSPFYALEPGDYDSVQIFSRATVRVRSGTYRINSLVLEPEVHFEADTSLGPVLLYVGDTLRLRSPITYVSGPRGQVLFGYLGSGTALFEEALVASVVAPNSTLELRRPNSQASHEGSFFAREIHVFSDGTVKHLPFDWSFLCPTGDADRDGTFDCFEGCDGGQCSGVGSRLADFKIRTPKGVGLDRVSIGARYDVSVQLGATVRTSGERLVTAAEGRVESAGLTGGIVARSGGFLSAPARVEGDLMSSSSSFIGAGAVVTGSVLSGQSLTPPEVTEIELSFPSDNHGDVLVRAGKARIIWPANYGRLTVEAGAKLYLQPGRYLFNVLEISTGARVEVHDDGGWTEVFVAESLAFGGEVFGIGGRAPRFVLGYGGSSSVVLGGKFKGSLLAPNAPLSITQGPHEGTFYGSFVTVAAGTTVNSDETSPSPTPVIQDGTPPDFVHEMGLAPGDNLTASTDEGTATFHDSTGFSFTIPERIPVTAGNAGNHDATLTFASEGLLTTCTYRGQAAVSHPTTLLDFADGAEYLLQSCDSGAVPGDRPTVTDVSLTVLGDSQTGGGKTLADLPLEQNCGRTYPDALSPGQSLRMRQSFAWPASGFRVAERSPDGRPALYYGAIYVTNQAELEIIDRLMIHRLKQPFFPSEWPIEWQTGCGKIRYASDGQGQWIFAMIPGVVYNRILEGREGHFNAEVSAQIPPMLLRSIPPEVAHSDGSLRLDVLYELDFRYLGLRGAVDFDALRTAATSQNAGYSAPGGPFDFLGEAIVWVAEAVGNFVNELAAFAGELEAAQAGGKRELTIDFTALNVDSRFDLNQPMQTTWGTRLAEMKFNSNAIRLLYVSSRLLTGLLPVESKGIIDSNGRAVVSVPKQGGFAGSNSFKHVCVEFENEASKFSPFLLPQDLCDSELFSRQTTPIPSNWTALTVAARYRDVDLAWYNEIRDARRYLEVMTGTSPRVARVVTGGSAWILTGFGNTPPYAPCLGYGDTPLEVLGPIVLAGLPALGLPAAILGQADIVAPGNSYDKRGIASHEYGHFGLCHLVREFGTSLPATYSLTFESLGSGSEVDAEEESRSINEAFADFIEGQVAGGVDYFDFEGRDSWEGGRVSVRGPGLDQNIFAYAPTYRTLGDGSSFPSATSVGRLATMLQDAFDGRIRGQLAPNSADHWLEPSPRADGKRSLIVANLDANGAQVRTDGHTDEEQVALSGNLIAKFVKRMVERDNNSPYRYRNFETALADLIQSYGTWCDACMVLAPHFAPGEKSVRAQIEQCAAEGLLQSCPGEQEFTCGSLRERIGEPPLGDPLSFDAFTCEPCPPQRVMDSDGHCNVCPTDLVVDVSALELPSCDGEQTYFGTLSPPGDTCPDVLVLEIHDPAGELEQVDVGLSPIPSGQEACEAARFSGFTMTRSSPTVNWSSPLPFDREGTYIPCPEPPCVGTGCVNPAQTFAGPTPFRRVLVQATTGTAAISLRTELCNPG